MPSAPRSKSLQAVLSAISILLFLMSLGFGTLTVHLFNTFNQLSDDLRENWLPTTRVLGDLNNDTSDYRAAEADILLASTAAERAAHVAQTEALGQSIAGSIKEYARIPHAAEDQRLFATFLRRWSSYADVSSHVTALAAAGALPAAETLYRGQSRTAYDGASDALGAATAYNVSLARQASKRTAEAYQQGRLMITLALVLAGALLTVALTVIKLWISDPLVDMAHTMRRLATNTTDLRIRGAGRHDEIGDMARAVIVFRANAIELLKNQRALAQQADLLEQELAHEQKLALLQRNFVAMISHEFRTPLTAIDAHAQRLIRMRDRVLPDDLAERAGRIRSAVTRITGLMDNLLNSSRLMDSEAELFFEPVGLDLCKVLLDACAFHRETSPTAEITLICPAATLPFAGDPKLLFQAFSNLLSNAIKYSPDEPAVSVSAQEGEADIRITITDRGLGIPDQDKANLFTRYYRGHNVSGIVGTGVGLYLAKTVVLLHRGTIEVESQEGLGSSFKIVFPRSIAA